MTNPAATPVSSGRSQLFPQTPASVTQPSVPSSNPVQQPVTMAAVESSVSRESAGSASQLKNVFEQKASAVQPAVASSNPAPQPAVDQSLNSNSVPVVSRDSAGSASQIKNAFEQKVNAAKQEETVKRKSWTAAKNSLSLPSGETASFRAHEQPYKARTAFNKPVREKQSLQDLLENGPSGAQ